MQRFLPSLLTLLIVLLAAAPAWAQPCTTNWTNAAGGDWNDAANWSGGAVPGPADDACVTLAGTYTVAHTSGAAIDVNSFTFGAATGTQTLDTSQGIVIASASTVSANGVVEWSAGFLSGATLTAEGEVVLDGVNFNTRGVDGVASVLRTEGTVTWEREEFTLRNGALWQHVGVLTAPVETSSAQLRRDGTGGELFDNSGTIRAETNTLFLRTDSRHDDATLTADAGATLSFDLGTHTFAGTTTGAPEGEVLVDAAIEAEAGAVWSLADEGMQWQEGFLTAGTLTNEGLVVLNGVNFNSRGVSGAATAFVNAGTVRWEQEEFTLSDAATWTNTGVLTAPVETSSAQLRRDGTGGELFDNSGTIRAETNTLFLRTDARHDDATLTADAGATLSFDLGAHTFAGTTTGAPEGEVLVDAAIEAEAGAVWDLAGAGVQWQEGFLTAGTLTNEGLVVLNGVNFNTRGVSGAATAFVNAGTVRWEQEEFTLSDAATWTNTGTLTVDAEAASVTLRRAGLAGESFDNAGIVSVDTGRLDVNTAFDHAAGALIQGNDTFDIRGSAFTQDGDTGPGTSPGLLTWQDDWAPSSGSTLFIEVGGSVPGTDYDQLAADGAATLAGTLDLSVAVGDAPGVGDTFTVLTAADGVTGTFDTVVPAFGYTFDVSYNANDVEVEVLTVPNFDLVAVNTDPTGDPVVVAKPGAIDFSYVVTNNTAAPITGDVFFTASLGATTLAQGVILSGTLPANASSPVLGFTQGIPGFAPVGSYTYSLKIGQFPNTVVGQVDFTVVVTASGARVAQGEGAWSLSGATPWLGADGAVLMGAAGAEQAPTTPEAASSAVPEAFGLAAAYPNPFRSQTTLALDVPEAGRVAVAVYDALGRRVAVLLNEEVEAATHRVAWDASGLPSGVYLVRATGAGQAAMQRVTLVR